MNELVVVVVVVVAAVVFVAVVVVVVVVLVPARVGGMLVFVGGICNGLFITLLVASNTIPSNTGLTRSLFDIRI